MNLNQAKAIVGIGETIAGRAALERATRQCVAEIVKARRKGDDDRAAKLSEAKSFFRRRLHRNSCAVCNVTIGRGATHCQAHRQGVSAKALPPAPGPQLEAKRPSNGNARISVISDPYAMLGYYTAPVQKVVAKWRGKISAETLQSYFFPVAAAVIDRRPVLGNMPFVSPDDWPAVFALGSAIAELVGDPRKAEGWLLRLSIHVATDGAFPSYAEIAERIRKLGGPTFKPTALAQSIKRMRLATPDSVSSYWRKTVMTKPD